MSEKLKLGLIKYGGCAALVGLMAWGYLAGRDLDTAETVDLYRYLCDAFTVPGILLLCFGALMWVSTTGFFDGIGYAMRYALFSLIPGKRLERDERYGDYVERKRENRAKGFGFLFISGAVTMAVALVFMALFYANYQG